ncbi:MAG: porin family protein [Rhodobiaceae bacterium]|nr:porin family protein [Rhodobiaceae bacterium]MCC0056860.1 porin family protein [Rhodobiaceae bacterium]
MPAHATDWSGFYAGFHAGYGVSTGSTAMDFLISGVPTPMTPPVPGAYTIGPDGFLAGGQAGFNFQHEGFVFGIEADISYSGLEGSASAAGSVTSGGPPVTSQFFSLLTQQVDWLATVRARVGHEIGETALIYITGGLAMGEVADYSLMSFTSVGTSTYIGWARDTKTGWTIGAGGEMQLSERVSVRGEYLFYDLGDTTVIGPLVGNPLNPTPTRTIFDHSGHIARLGVNFRFK